MRCVIVPTVEDSNGIIVCDGEGFEELDEADFVLDLVELAMSV